MTGVSSQKYTRGAVLYKPGSIKKVGDVENDLDTLC